MHFHSQNVQCMLAGHFKFLLLSMFLQGYYAYVSFVYPSPGLWNACCLWFLIRFPAHVCLNTSELYIFD